MRVDRPQEYSAAGRTFDRGYPSVAGLKKTDKLSDVSGWARRTQHRRFFSIVDIDYVHQRLHYFATRCAKVCPLKVVQENIVDVRPLSNGVRIGWLKAGTHPRLCSLSAALGPQVFVHVFVHAI